MKFNFKPFFDYIKKMGIRRKDLIEKYHIPASTLYRMKRGENISLRSILDLMSILDIMDLNDVIEIVEEKDR